MARFVHTVVCRAHGCSRVSSARAHAVVLQVTLAQTARCLWMTRAGLRSLLAQATLRVQSGRGCTCTSCLPDSVLGAGHLAAQPPADLCVRASMDGTLRQLCQALPLHSHAVR